MISWKSASCNQYSSRYYQISNCWDWKSQFVGNHKLLERVKQDGRTWCFMGQTMERAWEVGGGGDGGEGISIERHSPPTGHCRHTLHTANIVPIDNVEEEEEEDRVIRRRKGETSRQQKGGGGCPGQGALEVGGQGALPYHQPQFPCWLRFPPTTNCCFL